MTFLSLSLLFLHHANVECIEQHESERRRSDMNLALMAVLFSGCQRNSTLNCRVFSFGISSWTEVQCQLAHVRFGSKADICSAKGHVRFTPNSDRESGFPQTAMSALSPIADMCGATRDVRFGPIANPKLNCGVRKIVGKGFKCYNTFF